jgi:hypothetical protein
MGRRASTESTSATGRTSGGPASFLGRQPLAGLAGLALLALLIYVVGILPEPQRVPLQVLGPILLFGLPLLMVMAYWWSGWPVERASRPVSGAVNTLILGAGSVVLTMLGQLVIGGIDPEGLVETSDSIKDGVLTTFPFTLPLALAVIVAMVQITYVWGRWPLRRLSPIAGGWAALGLSWIIGVALYYRLANWESVPGAVRSSIGLRNPGSLWDGIDLTALLYSILLWQSIFGVLFDGFPFLAFRRLGAGVYASTAAVFLLGALTFSLLQDGVHFAIGALIAVTGSGVAAVFVVRVLLEAWPFGSEEPGIARVGLFVSALVVFLVAYFALRVGGDVGVQPPVGFWIGVSSLVFLVGGTIWHYSVWRRWPLPPPSPPR